MICSSILISISCYHSSSINQRMGPILYLWVVVTLSQKIIMIERKTLFKFILHNLLMYNHSTWYQSLYRKFEQPNKIKYYTHVIYLLNLLLIVKKKPVLKLAGKLRSRIPETHFLSSFLFQPHQTDETKLVR